MEATPPSPSVFHDLPPMAPLVDGSEDDDDLVLPYISRMLMEEDIADDKLSYQYDPDHPVLLKAQQPFAEILSSNAVPATCPCNNNSTTVDEVAMAFFKGMDDAYKFLPGSPDDGERRSRSWRKRLDGDDDAQAGNMGSKKMAPPLHSDDESEEEAAAREMLGRLMLDGYDQKKLADDMRQELNVADMAAKETPPRQPGRPRKYASGGTISKRVAAVDLHTLLIRCAEAVAANDRRATGDLLERIKSHSSPTGDDTQRLAHCFAKALEARVAGAGGQVYRSLVTRRASAASILKAYQVYMTCCCFIPVTHLFSNATIYNAVAGKGKLHIVHYGLGRGLQWPDLIRWLARRDGGPPAVRITGIDDPLPGFRPAQRLHEAGHLLSDYARQCGVPFEFHAIAASSEAIRVEDLGFVAGEVVVVNSMHHLQTLMDESVVVERPNPRDVVLGTIRRMRPAVFVHAVTSGSLSSAYFMTRFREALHSYTALFGMMDGIAARKSERRLLMEREIFACCATNIIACEGTDRVQRPQSYKQWQARCQRAGLRQQPLDPGLVQMIKDMVKKEYHKEFVINEDQRWLLQGWKGRVLYALSTWTVDDDN